MHRHLLSAAAAAAMTLAAPACGSKKDTPPETPPPATTTAAPAPETTAPPAETTAPPAETAAPAADVADAPPAEPAVDVVVWSASGDGAKATWYQVAGDEVTEVATRPEAALFDGTTLFALQTRWTRQNMMPCEALDDEGGEHAPSGAVDLPSLVARPLGSEAAEKVVVAAESAGGGFGDVDSNTISLEGSAGAVVVFEHVDTGYGCGAHGYDESGHGAFDVAAGAPVSRDGLRAAVSDLADKAREPIFAAAVKDECRSAEEPYAADDISLDGTSLRRTGDGVEVVYHFYVEPEAEWARNCEIGEDVGGPFRAETRLVAPTDAEQKALAKLGAEGVVGYSTVTLTGEARDAALTAFKDAATLAPPKPAPPAAPAVADGGGDDGGAAPAVADADASVVALIKDARKATAEKRYDDAIAAFSAAIEKDAKAARAWSGRGYAKLLAGKVDEADQDFDKALLLDNDDTFQAAVWFNKGLVAEKRGDKETARSHYETAKSKKPSKAVELRLKALGDEPSR